MRRESSADPAEIMRRTVAASGIDGNPTGNIHLKLELQEIGRIDRPQSAAWIGGFAARTKSLNEIASAQRWSAR